LKTLGVVSGLGPYAANSFIQRLLVLTDAEKEWDQFPIVAFYNTQIPSRTRSLLYDEPSPAPLMVETIKKLEQMDVDMVVVPCNSGHGWYDEVVEQIDVPWLNIIEVTSDIVKKQGIQRPLVLSAYVPYKLRLYEKYLDDVTYLKQKDRERLYGLIERLKVNADRDMVKKELEDIISGYSDKTDGIVIACTEPSMLFNRSEHSFSGIPLVDSMHEYAEKTVELCKEEGDG